MIYFFFIRACDVFYFLELFFVDFVFVDDDAGRFELGGFVEGDEEFFDYGVEFFYYFFTVFLYFYCRWVTVGVGVYIFYYLKLMILIVF